MNASPRPRRSLPDETTLVPLPVHIVPTSRFRSTWLTSSLQALEKRGHLARYRTLLPEPFHDPVFRSVAGTWLPVDVAVAHYGACDALTLPTTELVALGRETTANVHRAALSMAAQLARGFGATPFTGLEMLPRLWERIWTGGAVGVFKVGPKEARIAIAGWPCARFMYCRIATRGVVQAVCALFSQTVHVRDAPEHTSDTSISFRLAWV